MSLYTRARKHIDMDRVKELREEKIKREQIAKLVQEQEKIRAELEYIEAEESKYINWRRELEEGMTTSGMGMVNYAAVGDVNLGAAMGNISLSGDGGLSGYNATTQDSTSSYYKFDTMVVSITTTSSDWVISPGSVPQTIASGGSGSHTVVLPRTYSSLYFSAKDDGTFSASVQYQRRAPVNAFVSLDDPEANSFIRGGLGGSEERKAKLKDMLEAGNELMIKLGLEPSKTSPGDIELAQHMPTSADDYTSDEDPIEDGDFPDDPFDDSDFPDLDLAMNQGPSTPVKQYDGKFMPNPGAGRPGKIRLKGKAKLA